MSNIIDKNILDKQFNRIVLEKKVTKQPANFINTKYLSNKHWLNEEN